jgi:hypothetical protein
LLFLISYDRKQERSETFLRFASTDRRIAEDARLELELDLRRRGMEREVVILEAVDEDALRRTHSRYFADSPKVADGGESKYRAP